MEPSPSLSKNQKLLLIGSLLIAICLACLLLSRPSANGGALPARLPIEVCAGVMTSPRFQIGFYWTSPIFSYMPSLATSPTTACLEMPASWLPPNLPRQVAFPP